MEAIVSAAFTSIPHRSGFGPTTVPNRADLADDFWTRPGSKRAVLWTRPGATYIHNTARSAFLQWKRTGASRALVALFGHTIWRAPGILLVAASGGGRVTRIFRVVFPTPLAGAVPVPGLTMGVWGLCPHYLK